ncbi:UPAR/Ly6 domain-containing protein bou [Halyomorpha halys]|uniref:UPAR/Ly6 domain-containing protein bou n=1 Tax=Halyomorpha halys TaxID=286706 RepID=UPI0006D51090|nr:uncharacterized protein LOC106680989 [Halyomorpha halys]
MESAKPTIVVFLLCALVHSGNCILCYQCNSTDLDNPFQCRESLTSDIDIEPKPCDEVYNAAYCIKHTGRFEGGVGTRRYCSSVDMGNYCNYIKQPGDTKEYRSCVFTCDSDGCNGAPDKQFSTPLLIMVFGSIIMLRL